jgi:hypothetical protein
MEDRFCEMKQQPVVPYERNDSMKAKRRIKAKEFILDIRSQMTNQQLMDK